MTREQRAAAAVDKIIVDLTDRGGLDNEWFAIDREIQEEIRQTWAKIIAEFMA